MSLASSPLARLRAAFPAGLASPAPPRLRAAFLLALTALVVGMSLKYAAKTARPGDSGGQTRSAFLRWRGMVNDAFAGTNIYVGVHEYPNPPVMAIILRPFAALPPLPGALAWFYLKVAMAVFAAVWVFRLVSPGGSVPDAAKAVALLLALPPVLGDLSHNNVNIFVLFLVAACLEAVRRGWDLTAGLVLALAIACKVTPLLFLGYFAWKRCWKVLAGCAAGLVLWLAVVPGAAFGWDRNGELLRDWYRLMVERPVLKGEITTEHPNQAIPGFVYRLFTHSPSFVAYPDNIPTPAEYHNVADIGRPAAWWVVKGLTAAFAVAVVVLCRWRVSADHGSRRGWVFAAECSLVVLGMLLFSERTWKHHAVTLLLPFAVLAYCAFAPVFGRRLRAYLAATLLAVGLLTTLPGMLPTRAADLAMVYGTHTAAFVLLTAGVCVVLAAARWGIARGPDHARAGEPV
jgi:hypothetical protein